MLPVGSPDMNNQNFFRKGDMAKVT